MMPCEEAVKVLQEHRDSSPGWLVEEAIDSLLAEREDLWRELCAALAWPQKKD